jgi:aminoglycoside phosphotransferase family enzyme/predicted kinase
MEQQKLFGMMQDPRIYADRPKSIRIIQTHISYLALTGKFVYKVKKAVNFGFLDFSNLQKRKKFCDLEVKLNKRLCPDLYLGVVAITEKKDGIEFGGKGKIIDYAVKMREMPQESMMTAKINDIDKGVVDRIIKILVPFYKKAKIKNKFVSSFEQNVKENFEQTLPYVNKIIPKEQYRFIQRASELFIWLHRELFLARKDKIKECHGDLHTGNILVTDKIYIFDCIEFNERFRCSDVISDISFLGMDLDFLGRKDLSEYLIKRYVELSKDKDGLMLLDFYKCYRAYVRGKVNCFQNKPELAKKYFGLAERYAQNFDIKKKIPANLFVVGGLTGTGKSLLARYLALRYDAELLRSDEIRKGLANLEPLTKKKEDFGRGIYSNDLTERTYEEMFSRAKKILKQGRSCILDATFLDKKKRKKAKALASRVIFIETISTEKQARENMNIREKENLSISDGRWEIYLKQKEKYESFENALRINLRTNLENEIIKIFKKIES